MGAVERTGAGVLEGVVATLDELRREIDEIDATLHDLLIRRVEIGREVARAKSGGSGPNLRPGREAQVMRRLAARNRAPLSGASVGRIWREILSANLNQQIAITAALFAPENAIYDLAREYCGTASTLTRLDSAASVLDAVASGAAQIGILPGIECGAAWRWWPNLLDRSSGPKPRIIARLPFFGAGSETIDALIIAAQEPEASGDDATLFAIPGSQDPGAGRVIDSWGDDTVWNLVAVDGFIEHPTVAAHATWYRLGAYANPVPI